MSYRPYFHHSIEQLQYLFASSQDDIKTLKVLQNELGHRHRPQAKALKREVDDLVWRLADANSSGTMSIIPPPKPDAPQIPDRIIVECAYCKIPNFVSTLEGTLQHLSCSACKKPYEALYKYGVMRTTFPPLDPDINVKNSIFKWALLTVVFLIVLAIAFK
jgi:hypothetical protein